MNTPDDGGPAFPVPQDTSLNFQGMTLRDYAVVHFIAALMQRKEFSISSGNLETDDMTAKVCFIAQEQADEMIKSRATI